MTNKNLKEQDLELIARFITNYKAIKENAKEAEKNPDILDDLIIDANCLLTVLDIRPGTKTIRDMYEICEKIVCK